MMRRNTLSRREAARSPSRKTGLMDLNPRREAAHSLSRTPK